MSETFDPKELKVLSDILALVLEDQPGQSATALETIRSRARRNGMTGGALKNLFIAIAPDPPKRAASSTRSRSTKSSASADVQQERMRVRELTESVTKLDLELRSARANNAQLKTELFLTQQARAETQSQLSAVQATSHTRFGLVGLAVLVGCVAGVAGTELFHSLRPAPHHTPNSVYLH
ncbi:hypothetical protein [Acetobacter oeni]|uniref:Uncharacterized protein n=1 Tax=Acetobacter oeni TaxID=304077 RepID=A0A511XFY6_9PROT|nr:hypothetical protein [Acetobacter oeni]MBB3882243.1 hypothetical protein [Acetobacter oeni]NHO17999.1 hypothetical protein [Acetobacter oeni]GBR01230.1 hypothetical protein AA21952_0358 [Acetobacter oeni LMG 21952]GEN61838.1 hypothetical protein AOE01nite_00620 [Acetobacter oeni]